MTCAVSLQSSNRVLNSYNASAMMAPCTQGSQWRVIWDVVFQSSPLQGEFGPQVGRLKLFEYWSLADFAEVIPVIVYQALMSMLHWCQLFSIGRVVAGRAFGIKMGLIEVDSWLVWMEWCPPGLSVCLPLVILLSTKKPEEAFFWHWLTQVVRKRGCKMVVILWCGGYSSCISVPGKLADTVSKR